MSRRRQRPWKNPKLSTGSKVALGVAGLAAGGGLLYALTREEEVKKPARRPGEQPTPVGTGAPVGGACDLGLRYPGFRANGLGVCVPGDETPGGIYVHTDCTDFSFKSGPGDQTTHVADMVAAAATAQESVDPVQLTTQYLQTYWPECTWPPVSDGPPRIVQLFMALAFQIGRKIHNAGGVVLSTTDADKVDEAVASRLADIGLENFQPDLVPEIVLPPYVVGGILKLPPGFPLPGLPPQEPQPPKGGIVPSGDEFPSPGGGAPQVGAEVKPDCLVVPYTKSEEIELADMQWSQYGEWNMWLFNVADVQCETFRVRFGLCLRDMTIFSRYGLLSKLAENYPTKMLDEVQGNLKFQISDGASQKIPLEPFRHPYLWKKQYEAVLRRGQTGLGAAEVVSFEEIDDPSLDGCPGRSQHYPLPVHGPGFSVNEGIANWRPEPTIELVHHPDQVLWMMLRIRYSGLPVFDNIEGDAVRANGLDKNGYTAYLKVNAIGIT